MLSRSNNLANYAVHLTEQFDQALLNSKKIFRTFRIGHDLVHLNFAGDNLYPEITEALEHLAVDDSSPPHLSINVWDSASTSLPFPGFPWKIDTKTPTENIDFLDPNFVDGDRIYFSDENFCFCYEPLREYLSFLDKRTSRAFFWVSDKNLAIRNDYRPFLYIFQWYFQSIGQLVIHASAVGFADGGVIMVGVGGSGKSTSAIACLPSDLLFAGDDSVLIDLNDMPYVHSLYNTAKLTPESYTILGFTNQFNRIKATAAGYKDTILLHQQNPEKTVVGFPIKMILAPKVDRFGEPRIERISPAQAMLRLAPSSLFHVPIDNALGFQVLKDLVNQVPSYYLYVNERYKTIPQLIINSLKD